jgi:hypothetical protein
MLDIYCNAWNVCIWIGESDDTDEAGQHPMDFIPSIVNLKLLDRMVATEGLDEKTAVSWVAFATLLRRPWFRRRWVIQEVSSSRSASVQCGSKSVNWIDFADAVQLFMVKLERIRATYDSSSLSNWDPDALNHVESTGAKAIVATTNNLLRKTENGTILNRLLNIESLVMTFLNFETTDLRDTIYALLPLASDGHLSVHNSNGQINRPSLAPDYTKSAYQVYIGFVRHCVLSSGSLDIICRHWALLVAGGQGTFLRSFSTPSFRPPNHDDPSSLPTWVGLVTGSPFGLPSRFAGRLNGDSLVGEPGHRIYNASPSREAEFRFSKVVPSTHPEYDNALFDGTLFVNGVILSHVSRVSSRVIDGTIPDECLGIAGWNGHDDVNDIPDRLWRSLVADRASDGSNSPFWYRRACMYSLKKASPVGDLNTSKLIANKSLPETVIEYLKRVQAVVWNRKFLVCQDLDDDSKSLFGLGSRYIREGDLVCILFGCSVPVILREKRLSEDSHFEFMGECYIHGKMDGEALAGMEKKTIMNATKEFNIR